MDELDTPVTPPSVDGEATELPEGIHPEGKELDPAESTTEITPELVRRLRTEAAEARVRAGRVDDFAAELFRVVAEREASAYLRDGSDLRLEASEFLTDEGYPDVHRIRQAAQTLAEQKPYLSRVAGNVGAGARPATEEPVSLGGLLRNAAR